jgi:serine-type D-Ala-D-Ala carboxypeptidase (penicillin-binding protein 5/6)
MSYRGPGPRVQRSVYRPRASASGQVGHWLIPVGAIATLMIVLVATFTLVRGPSVESAGHDAVVAAARFNPSSPAAVAEALKPHGPVPRIARPIPLPVMPGRAFVLMDQASGEILAESGGTTQHPPASVTKIATAILLLELGHLDDTVTVDADFNSLDWDSTLMGLKPGDRYTVRDLLYGLMLPSGNDAALAVARVVSGDEARFVNTMNALAARLELKDTHFTDPHGLGGPLHYTSARDLARLTRYGFTLPGFAEVVRTRQWNTRGSESRELWNSNVFLYMYDGADGVKIGYTEEADRTLVASATRDGRRLIAVVLGDSYAATHAGRLLDWGWASLCWPAADGSCVAVRSGG